MTQSPAFMRFYADAVMHLPGAIPQTMQPEMLAVMRDFLQHTNIWNVERTVNVTSASNTYVVAPDASANFKRLLNFYQQGDVTKRWFWPVQMQMPGTLVLQRTVDQPYTLVAVLAQSCIDPVDANGDPVFPSWILDDYFEGLKSGMIAKCMMQPAKSYSNPQLAVFHWKTYRAARQQAMSDVLRANLYDAQAWVVPQALVTTGRQRGV